MSRKENSWQKLKWGDLSTLEYGKGLRTYSSTGTFPVYGTNGQIGWHSEPLCPLPGIIVGRKGAYRGIHFSKTPFFVIDTAFYLKPLQNNSFNIKWAYQLLDFDINKLDSGSAIPSTSREAFYQIPVNVPPFDVQHKIASILSAYDDLIENNSRRIQILEEVARMTYREWFVNFRFPGHERTKFVDSPFGMIPEGWQVVSIRNVTSLINRGISPKYDETSDEVIINQKCIRNEKVNLNVARRHITKVPEQKYIRFGDVLINSTGIGTLGRVAQVYQKLSKCTVDSHVTIARPNEKVFYEYFGCFMETLQSVFDSLGVGSTGQTELGRETISNTDFLLPEKSVQEMFGKIVSPIKTQIHCFLKKNEVLKQTRDLLLPKLISGQIDVSDLDIQI